VKTELVRKKILDTASDLFYHKGYNLTGINEIIKEAGVAKATLYHHFKSKDEICLAFIIQKNSQFLKDIESFVFEFRSGKDQCLAFFDFLLKFYESNAFNGCWCINTISELPKNEKKIRKLIQSEKDKLISLIEKVVEANNIGKEENRSRLSKQIYLLYEGAISESHMLGKSWPIKEARTLCEIIL